MTTEETFLKELKDLLKKYDAELSIENNYQGYPECGDNTKMIVQFDDFTLNELPLGKWIDGDNHG